MSLFPPDVSEARFRELCAPGCPESQTLEFKQSLPGLGPADKNEFLKDVCGLANSSGGEIVYGVSEHEGEAKDICPIVGESADAAKLRLGQMLDARLEPRLVGRTFQVVPTAAGGYVLILQVPASFAGPHRYRINEASRFVMRNGTQTIDMTYEQVRTAFDRTATLTERARQFREERLRIISTGGGWKPLRQGPVCVVHLIPIASMAGNRSVDIQELHNGNNFMQYAFASWLRGVSRTTNLDGLVVYPPLPEGEPAVAYTQVFRTGELESARYAGRLVDDSKIIPSGLVADFAREGVKKFLSCSKALNFTGPAIVGLALLRVVGYEFGAGTRMFPIRASADRPDLVLPETWVDGIESVSIADEVTKPLLNILWQAFGIERCDYYDQEEYWRKP